MKLEIAYKKNNCLVGRKRNLPGTVHITFNLSGIIVCRENKVYLNLRLILLSFIHIVFYHHNENTWSIFKRTFKCIAKKVEITILSWGKKRSKQLFQSQKLYLAFELEISFRILCLKDHPDKHGIHAFQAIFLIFFSELFHFSC